MSAQFSLSNWALTLALSAAASPVPSAVVDSLGLLDADGLDVGFGDALALGLAEALADGLGVGVAVGVGVVVLFAASST